MIETENERMYREILEKILKDKVKLFGDFAVYLARATPGLQLDDHGSIISISDNPKEVMRYLLLKFEDKAGKVTTVSDWRFIAKLKIKYPQLDLPEELT